MNKDRLLELTKKSNVTNAQGKRHKIKLRKRWETIKGKNHYSFKGRVVSARGYIWCFAPNHPNKNYSNYVMEKKERY